MTALQHNISLKLYNSFGIEAKAKYFFKYQKPNDIKYLLSENLINNTIPRLILGGGSNQLFTKDYDGLVIHPVNDKIEFTDENNDFIFIKADAGCNWDKLVEYTVNKGYGGLENLSDIPGNVGASPVQNIGAYGVEAKDSIYTVHLVSLTDGSLKTLNNTDCKFDYRYSIFKGELMNKYIVDSVTYKLRKDPEFITHYGSLSNELEQEEDISLKTIRNTIIRIRKSKLPSPIEIGNAGSFFKNPVVDKLFADKLKAKFGGIVTYDVDESKSKIAAGWLIDQCGLKGYINHKGTAAIHEKQALVLINKGNASGKDIIELAEFVKQKVFEKFEVILEPEVIFV